MSIDYLEKNTAKDKFEYIKEKLRESYNKKICELVAVIDPESKRVLYFTQHLSVARCFLSSKSGTSILVDVNYRLNGPINHNIPCYNWILSENKLLFQPEEFENKQLTLFEDIRNRGYALEAILSYIAQMQIKSMQGFLPNQHQIYSEKARQARLVLEGEFDSKKVYYVNSWAEIRDIPLDQAANEILFKHENHNIYLHTTENSRLKYTKKILEEDIDNIPFIVEDFFNEGFYNGYI
jgi:hypothetical protein